MGVLETSVQATLDPDEYIRAKRAVAPAGSLGAALGGGVSGGLHGLPVALHLAADVMVEGARTTSEARRTGWQAPKKVNLLVITNKRVLLGQTRLGRYVRTIVESPVREVASLEVMKAKVAFGKLHLHFHDGRFVELDLKSDRNLDAFLVAAGTAFPCVGP